MSAELINAVKRHVAAMIAQVGQTRIATVASVNPNDHTARVLVQPEGVMTGWLPIITARVGTNSGIVSLPQPGDQVTMICQEGASEHGIVMGSIYSDDVPPPKTYTDPRNKGTTSVAQPGEVLIVAGDGTFIRLVGGNVLIHGNLYVDGDVFDKNGPLDRLRQEYDGHLHSGVKAGSDTSGPTTTPDPGTL